ncbi:hypothetical protein RSSM_06840 [Rhodopirellula sallentina SM41]|uniref:Uncharacterized protein n=1 Tax=Rhodopirellula sallentina SM41 TaxID=1263870 RepID=M5U6Y9_9BACT|nr:hypothetical protein RSSM_06840 [Rhodopirellula sallentina SM41]
MITVATTFFTDKASNKEQLQYRREMSSNVCGLWSHCWIANRMLTFALGRFSRPLIAHDDSAARAESMLHRHQGCIVDCFGCGVFIGLFTVSTIPSE